ncbi:MAG: FAD-dependent oxidoreductase [Thermodesulfobacteriota bacterium]
MKNYLIVGNGAAGTTAAEHIRKQDKDGKITILTEEDMPFYYRVRLPEVISGELQEEKLLAKKEAWYKEQAIDLRLKTRVVGAESGPKALITGNGERFPYDTLLIAAGSRSFIPPFKGADKQGVFALRSIQDARNISAWAKGVERVVLIGGGLLGLEAGNALRKLGKQVMVVEFFPRLLPRQLDVDGAKRLQSIMEGMGFSFRLGAKTQEITGEGRVEGVLLEGGENLPGQMVIVSAGVRPAMDLVKPLGLDADKGIKVDEHMRTSKPDIYAAGDVAEFRGIPYGIWTAAMDQGKIAGINMAGGEAVYQGTTMANTLKVVGIDLASAGDIDAENKFECRVVADEKVYKKLVVDQNRIIGCIMLGDTRGFTRVTKMMAEKQDVSKVTEPLL